MNGQCMTQVEDKFQRTRSLCNLCRPSSTSGMASWATLRITCKHWQVQPLSTWWPKSEKIKFSKGIIHRLITEKKGGTGVRHCFVSHQHQFKTLIPHMFPQAHQGHS